MKKSRKKKNLKSKILFLPVIFFLLFLAYKFFVQLDEALFLYSRHKSELEKLKREYEIIRDERLRYEDAIAKLKDDSYVELIARKQFRMVRPGEKAYVVIFKESTANASENSSDQKVLVDR